MNFKTFVFHITADPREQITSGHANLKSSQPMGIHPVRDRKNPELTGRGRQDLPLLEIQGFSAYISAIVQS